MLSLYSKGGGSHGNHSWVVQGKKITELSYISVQIFEPARGHVFRAQNSLIAPLPVRYYQHIRPSQLLYVLPDRPIVRNDNGIVELRSVSISIWSEIQSIAHLLPKLVKELEKQK